MFSVFIQSFLCGFLIRAYPLNTQYLAIGGILSAASMMTALRCLSVCLSYISTNMMTSEGILVMSSYVIFVSDISWVKSIDG